MTSASEFELVESALAAGDARLDTVVPAGEGFIGAIASGETLRIVDLEGNQAVDTLFYDANDLANRYSAVDTIRAQGLVYLGAGSKLLSIRNESLLEITADTCGRHDTLGGACSAESNTVRYALDKHSMHACRDTFSLLVSQWGHGFSKRDVTHNINFFMNVPVTPEGGLRFDDGISAPGRYVELRAATDVLVVISNCPQLNNPCNAYDPTPIGILVWGV